MLYLTIRKQLKQIGKTCKEGIWVPHELTLENSTAFHHLQQSSSQGHFSSALLQVIKKGFASDNEKDKGYHIMRSKCQQQNQNSIRKNPCLFLVEHERYHLLWATGTDKDDQCRCLLPTTSSCDWRIRIILKVASFGTQKVIYSPAWQRTATAFKTNPRKK